MVVTGRGVSGKRVDCFLLFDEVELLEVRLHALAPHVDEFVIGESVVTFSGNPKPLHYADNRSRYSQFPIRHVVIGDGKSPHTGRMVGEAWQREYYQRQALLEAATAGTDGDDTILLSDVDEIPDLANYNGGDGVFRMKLFYYYLNCYTGEEAWRGTTIMRRGDMGRLGRHRDRRHRLPVVGGGWHFSTLGTPERIVKKIEAFSHQEFNTPEYKAKIARNREALTDPYNRPQRDQAYRVEMPSGPQWLLDNAHKYPHLFITTGQAKTPDQELREAKVNH